MEFTKSDMNKTIWAKPDSIIKARKWYLMDAKGKTLWRLANDIANKLMGKDKVYYSDFWDTGDFVVITNAAEIVTTWNKMADKIYFRYSWYKGHVKEATLAEMMAKHPERVIFNAVRWMLPKNKLRDRRMKRLKIFVGDTHTYENLPLEKI